MLKRVLLISGSPRREGNNGVILDRVERTFKDNDAIVHRFEPHMHKVSPCIYCRHCEMEKGCVIKDDMQWLYGEFDRSDIIVVSSPLYFNSVTAQLKALVDRCQAIWSSKYVLEDPIIDRSKERKGYFICTAGGETAASGFEGALKVIEIFFKAVNVKEWGKLLIPGVDSRPVWERGQLLQDISRAAEKLLSSD